MRSLPTIRALRRLCQRTQIVKAASSNHCITAARSTQHLLHISMPASPPVATKPSRRYLSDKTPPEDSTLTSVRVTITDKEEVQLTKSDNDEVDRSQFTVPIEVKMPELGYEHYKGTIETWYKQPGDIIRRDDILCDITTPDFTFGMSTDDVCDAIMGEIVVKAGESAEDHALICTIWHPKEKSKEEAKQEDKKE